MEYPATDKPKDEPEERKPARGEPAPIDVPAEPVETEDEERTARKHRK